VERVRKCTEKDVEQVYELISELEETMIDKSCFVEIYNDNLSNSFIHYYVYEMDNKVVGFISLHIQKLLHHTASIGEIQELIVQKAARSKGIGRVLFEKAKEVCCKNNCLQMEVCCNQKRLASHKFYESQGMTNNHFKFCLTL